MEGSCPVAMCGKVLFKTTSIDDGRAVSAEYDGTDDEWTVWFVEAREAAISGHSLPRVVAELLRVDEKPAPRWVLDVADRIGAVETPLGPRFPCPCCGYLTLADAPPGSWVYCEVCRWEDDQPQFDDIDYPVGANRQSWREARRSYAAIGASSERVRARARAPLPEEVP